MYQIQRKYDHLAVDRLHKTIYNNLVNIYQKVRKMTNMHDNLLLLFR